MKHVLAVAAALILAASPAQAGYKLMASGTKQPVGKLGLSVVPANDWNRLGSKIGRNAESWTLDGMPLNELTFYAGIEDGRTLFREIDKKNRPLPKFSGKMLAPDLVQLFEGSYRVAAGTALFSIGSIEPAAFAGHPGVRFTYSFVQQGEEVKRNGEATGAIVNGKLYLITFEAPVIHYYDRDLTNYRKLVESAKVG